MGVGKQAWKRLVHCRTCTFIFVEENCAFMLSPKMREGGYIPTSMHWVLQDIFDDANKELLYRPSEKLDMESVLIKTRKGTHIHVQTFGFVTTAFWFSNYIQDRAADNYCQRSKMRSCFCATS